MNHAGVHGMLVCVRFSLGHTLCLGWHCKPPHDHQFMKHSQDLAEACMPSLVFVFVDLCVVVALHRSGHRGHQKAHVNNRPRARRGAFSFS